MPSKVVAVTGGSGQIGTLVLRRLVNDPDIARVISIDRRPPYVASTKLQPIDADIRDHDLARHFTNCEAVVHCAALVAARAPPEIFHSVNVDGGKNVFRAAVSAGVKTIVHISSVMAYGCAANHPVPIDEHAIRVDQPDFPYVSCKFQLEEFIDQFEKDEPDVAISRIRANVLIGRNMPHLLGKLLHVGWIPDIGGTPLPLVWDEDVADLVMAALRNRARGAFNASAEDLLNADELGRRVGFRSVRTPSLLVLAYRTLRAALASFGLHLLPDPAWVDKMRGAMLVASSKRARTELGWCPHYPTATAVVKRFQEVSPRGTDLRVQLFLWFSILLLDRRSAILPDRRCRINICVDGPTGRDLTFLLTPDRIKVASGPRPNPSSTIVLRDSVFRALLVGTIEPDRARRDGRISVEGEAADWTVFRRLVELLVAPQRAGGIRGTLIRFMARLLASSKPVDRPDSSSVR